MSLKSIVFTVFIVLGALMFAAAARRNRDNDHSGWDASAGGGSEPGDE